MNREELKALMLEMINDLETKGDGQYALAISEDIATAVGELLPIYVRISPTAMLWPDPTGMDRVHQMVTVNRTLPPKTWIWSLKT